MAQIQDQILSEGSLNMIIEQMNDKIQPIVQILGTKVMASKRIRSVIWDGQTMCQHCIFVPEELEDMYNEGKLDKYTVIKLVSYSVNMLTKKENMPVILVNELTILKQGKASSMFDKVTI